MAQRVGRGIALLFHGHGTRKGWGVSVTPGRSLPPGKDPVPIVQEAGWAPGLVWTGGKSRSTGIRSLDRPALSQSLYRLSYPAHRIAYVYHKNGKQNITNIICRFFTWHLLERALTRSLTSWRHFNQNKLSSPLKRNVHTWITHCSCRSARSDWQMRSFRRYSNVTGVITVFFRSNMMYNASVRSREISIIELISKH